MPLFSNRFRQNLSNLRKEKTNCTFTYNLLTYLERPNITPIGFFIFLDNINVKNPTSFKKIAFEILRDIGICILQHQATLQHNLEDLEKLGILFKIQTMAYKQYLKSIRHIPLTTEAEIQIRQEIDDLLRCANAM